VERNHNRTTAGRYNINKEGTSGGSLVRGRDLKKFNFKDEVLKQKKQNNFNEYNKTTA
jgi:hypothetical protein